MWYSASIAIISPWLSLVNIAVYTLLDDKMGAWELMQSIQVAFIFKEKTWTWNSFNFIWGVLLVVSGIEVLLFSTLFSCSFSSLSSLWSFCFLESFYFLYDANDDVDDNDISWGKLPFLILGQLPFLLYLFRHKICKVWDEVIHQTIHPNSFRYPASGSSPESREIIFYSNVV